MNRFIEQHSDELPIEFTLLKYKPVPWTPTDTLVISGYMYETLTDTWEEEIDRAKVTEKSARIERGSFFLRTRRWITMSSAIRTSATMVRSGSHLDPDSDDDDDDDDDMEPDGVLKANALRLTMRHKPVQTDSAPDLTTALANSVVGYIRDSQSEIRHSLGSNNWVVSGDHTATGKPLLANDTHLELSIPPIWYEIHLTAPGWNVKGFTLPGRAVRRHRAQRSHCLGIHEQRRGRAGPLHRDVQSGERR